MQCRGGKAPGILRRAQSVADHPKRTSRGDGRVLLSQRTGRAVAGVGERRLTLLDEAGIQARKIGDHEEDLAANLQHRRDREFLCPGECLGNITDGACVEGHILADAPITTGRGPLQTTLPVDQRDRHPVDLQLAQVVRLGAEFVLHPDRPRLQLLGIEDVIEAEHPFEMLGGSELGGEAGPADELRGRICHPQFRVALLERGELMEQRVEFRVGDDRRVFDVVPELVLAHLVG